VAKLEELDTGDIEPTTHAFSITNAFREDIVEPSLDQDKALANGPDHSDDSFVVPRVI
jgi:aspartyl-tRNA(Asn)/glutamyl-tRNA(Gln) amidotransferase subunit C